MNFLLNPVPAKERSGFGGGHEEDAKFDNPWRRDGPLPDRVPPRNRFEGSDRAPPPSVADEKNDWRSSRPRPSTIESEPPVTRKKSAGFVPVDSIADKEEEWSRGSKFKASSSAEEAPTPRFGASKPRQVESTTDESDWRRLKSGARISRKFTHPFFVELSGDLVMNIANNSTPPTPQVGRRKLELLPRSENASSTPSPLASPKMSSTAAGTSKANPFGAARSVKGKYLVKLPSRLAEQTR